MTITDSLIVLSAIAVALGFCALLYSGDRDERGYRFEDEADGGGDNECGGH